MKAILEARPWNPKAVLLGSLVLLVAVNLVVYVLQLAETNAYIGYQPLTLGPVYLAVLVLSLLIIWVFVPTRITQPSDFFRYVYGIFVLVPYALFHGAGGAIGISWYACMFALLLAPVLVVSLLGQVRIGLLSIGALSVRALDFLVVVLVLVTALITLRLAPASAGFGILDVYERRVEARDIFVSGSALAYATIISTNSLIPFLAYSAGVRARTWLLIASLVLAAIFFYALGGKASLVYLFLAYLLGKGARKERGATLHRIVFLSISATFCLVVVEWVLTGYSLTAELTFRRAFAGTGHVMASYFDLMFSDTGKWSAWSGIHAPGGVTYLVGELYFDVGAGEDNVDTNAFVYALAAGGLPAFMATILLTGGVLWFFDAVHRATHNSRFLYLGFAFSILIAEQAATTALVSSGIGLLTALTFLSRDEPVPLRVASPPRSSLLPASHS